MKRIYIAGPYTHEKPEIRQARFEQLSKIAGDVMRLGYWPYSPISHSHPIAEYSEIKGDWDAWEKIDKAEIENCDAMVVVCLCGWSHSVGLKKEKIFADNRSIPVLLLENDDKTVETLKQFLDGLRREGLYENNTRN